MARATAGSDGVLAGYCGHVDAIEPVLSGWVVQAAHPAVPVALIVSIDGESQIPLVADRPRPDVAAAGLGGPYCGFAAALPSRLLDGAAHEVALLLPDGRNLNLPGRPQIVALGEVPAELIPASAADVDAVLDLLRRNDGEAGFDPHLVGPDNAAAFNAIRSPEQGFVVYARAGARLVGYGRLDRGRLDSDRGDAAGFGVVALTVLAAYRRKGLGEALMRALLKSATATPGLRQVWLSVRPDNAPAIRLYEKLGFVRDANHPPGRWAVPGEVTMVWLPASGRR
jgi:ribosomal protein S18 acetylase RimI-like enzyme